MSKVLKVVAIVAVAVAIVVFAAPIAGALASVAGSVGIGTGIATAALISSVVGIGISLGLSAISTLFRKSASLSNSMADRLSSSIVPSAPRKIVFGRTAAGADIRFIETWGSKKDQYAQVIALASHRVNAISQFYCEDNLSFATDPDSYGGGPNSTFIGRRRFTKLVRTEYHYRNWHPMTNWSGFGTSRDAKQMVWYRAAVRPATAGEILAQKANSTADNAQARITDESTARVNADSALASRANTLEAQMRGEQDSTLAARVRDEATARTNADSALATRASNLEVSATGSSTVAKNGNFANWPDGQSNPTSWGDWLREGNYRVERVNGVGGSPYAIRTLNDVADVSSGFVQSVRVYPGKWVFEVTAESDPSGFRGAGLTLSGVYSLDFLGVPDVSGYTGDKGNSLRSWSMIFDITHNESLSFHAMHGWSGFGRGMAAKYMIWHKIGLRPAGPGDLAGVKNAADIVTANARIGNEETARANADSALASRTSVVEAQVVNDSANLVRNGIFNAPGWVRGSSGIPAYWGGWTQENGAYIGASDRTSNYGAAAPLQIDRNGNNNGISQNLGTQAAGWYVLEVDITAEDGNWTGCGVHINFNNGYSRNFHFGSEADTNGGVVSGNIGSVNRKFSTMFYNGNVGTNVMFYLMAGWEGFATGQGFLRTIWHKAVVRPASDAEIKAQKVQDANLIARVTSNEGAIATVAGKTEAYFEKKASVPGADAFISAVAKNDNGVATSNVAIGGTSIALYNLDNGQAKRAMYLSGGNAIFNGSITADGGVLIGNGKLPVQVQSFDRAVSDGTYVSYGITFTRPPAISFGASPVALASGEVPNFYAENLTTSGFTARLRINSAPQSSAQASGAFAAQSDGSYQVNTGGRPAAANGQYTLTVSMNAQNYAYDDGGGQYPLQ